ncbi:MAG TPA: hypothetical protein VEZ47_05290 [Gemmatirosa sp.]|nr:hypothetical protein [Gemmatirosa sp.]
MRIPSSPNARRSRGPLARWSSALVAVLYLLAWGEPLSMHACPKHDGPAVAALGAGPTLAGAPDARLVGNHGGHADHGAHAAAATPAGAPGHDGDAHLCDCLGHGCCPPGVVAPTAQAVRWHVLVRRQVEPPAAPLAPRPRAPAPRLLPFANGPPALA